MANRPDREDMRELLNARLTRLADSYNDPDTSPWIDAGFQLGEVVLDGEFTLAQLKEIIETCEQEGWVHGTKG